MVLFANPAKDADNVFENMNGFFCNMTVFANMVWMFKTNPSQDISKCYFFEITMSLIEGNHAYLICCVIHMGN